MALQHLRSSTANKRPLPAGMSDGQLAINTESTSPGLFFKNSGGNLVKVGPVHVGTTAPNATPASGGQAGNSTGELWLDTSLTPNELKTWDGSAWVSATGQEIPVSKLIDGSARQLLQTDAAGTGVEWTDNVDIPGTLDVTSTATFDSIARHPLGSASAPTITFTGDTNTGLYSPSADQVAISNNGTERLRVTSDGKLGLGTSSPDATLKIQTVSSDIPQSAFGIRQNNAADTAQTTLNVEIDPVNSTSRILSNATSSPRLALYTSNQAALYIDESQRIGIGNTSPSSLLHLADGGEITVGTTTGTKIGTATSQKIGFYNTTPVVQPTTGVTEAAFVENSGGTAVNVDSTFGGYTIQQVVQALQNLGLLA